MTYCQSIASSLCSDHDVTLCLDPGDKDDLIVALYKVSSFVDSPVSIMK